MSYKNQLAVILKSMELNDRQIKIYFCLLDGGAMAPATVARLLDMSRSTCYDILRELHKDYGLITSTKLNNKMAYFVENPKKILEILKNKKRNLNLQLRLAQDAVENIEYELKRYKQPKIKIHTGVEGIKQIYNETLECKDKELLIYFGEDFYPSELEDFIINEYIPNRVKSGIKAKVICHKHLLLGLDDYQLRKTKELTSKKGEAPHLEVNVFNNKTQFITYANNEYTGITIEHPEIAKAMKALHGLIWEDGK